MYVILIMHNPFYSNSFVYVTDIIVIVVYSYIQIKL